MRTSLLSLTFKERQVLVVPVEARLVGLEPLHPSAVDHGGRRGEGAAPSRSPVDHGVVGHCDSIPVHHQVVEAAVVLGLVQGAGVMYFLRLHVNDAHVELVRPDRLQAQVVVDHLLQSRIVTGHVDPHMRQRRLRRG